MGYTNSGTDEQKLDMRLDKTDEQAHHCDDLKPEKECVYQVDSAGIEGSPPDWMDREDAVAWGGPFIRREDIRPLAKRAERQGCL